MSNKITDPGDAEWKAFVTAACAFAPYLDQFKKVRFQTAHGMIYLTISRSDPYPDSFEDITDAD